MKLRKMMALGLAVALTLSLSACGEKSGYKVGICQLAPHVALDAATQGFTDALAKELGDKQNKTVCPVCGKQCANTDTFCSTCGAKLEPEPEPIPQEGGPNDAAAAQANEGPDAQVSDLPPRQYP